MMSVPMGGNAPAESMPVPRYRNRLTRAVRQHLVLAHHVGRGRGNLEPLATASAVSLGEGKPLVGGGGGHHPVFRVGRVHRGPG